MKKLIVLSAIMTVTLLMGSSFSPAQPQEPANEEKPTFYRLVPGTYVNGWPRFTIHYPKDWVEYLSEFPIAALITVGTPGDAPRSWFGIFAGTVLLPLDKFVDNVAPYWRNVAKDVTVVSDKPSRLRDGTSAREVELQMVLNGVPFCWLGVATKKGDYQINANLWSYKGRIGDDLKAIPYSLQYEPSKDEPVQVPPDVQEFLDRHNNDVLSHDVAKIMSHYSDKYLNSGVRKGERERFWRQGIGNWMSSKMTITDFVPAGDRAYFAGFVIINNRFTLSLTDTTIIKENGEWKWYGNQRDVSR